MLKLYFSAVLCVFLSYLISRKILTSEHGKAWFIKGWRDIRDKQTLFGVLIFNFVVFLGTCAVYLKYGGEKLSFEYATFAFPCMAGIVAGGGFFFDEKTKFDTSGWFFIASAFFLTIAYVIFIWPTKFFWQIAYFDIILIVGSSTCGLIYIARHKNYTKYQLDGLFLPVIMLGGAVVFVSGLILWAFEK